MKNCFMYKLQLNGKPVSCSQVNTYLLLFRRGSIQSDGELIQSLLGWLITYMIYVNH